jgi:plastocyanin
LLWATPSATITFAAAGEFAYYCKVHPMMKASITVA